MYGETGRNDSYLIAVCNPSAQIANRLSLKVFRVLGGDKNFF
jgi:hypothetical protein